MRVLWVTAEPPDRRRGGGNIRQSYLLESVARAHQVDLLLAGDEPDPETSAAVRRVVRGPVPPPPHRGPVARRVKALRLATGAGPAELYDGRAARGVLEKMWPAETYDVVMVEHAALAPLVRLRRPGETWVCTLQNVGSGTMAALHDLTSGARQRWVYARETTQSQQLERFVVERFDLVVTVSPEDAALLPGASAVVTNGVDLASFPVVPLPAEPRLLFTGTLSYLPNVDGLEWFCAEVLPLVRAQVPHVVLDVVGRDVVPRVRALADGQQVVLHPDVPAVQPFLQAARVCVVPLRIGTGSRLKALEAMAAGRPLVGTTVGLAGLDLTDQAVVADHPAGLAAALVRVLRDDTEAQRLAAAGRAHVERSFGWDTLGRQLLAQVEAVSRT